MRAKERRAKERREKERDREEREREREERERVRRGERGYKKGLERRGSREGEKER